MQSLIEPATLLTGVLIFLARVFDVTMGTIRTISIVQGRTWIAFVLGLAEVTMWLFVISTVLAQIGSKPILGVFYALGFSAGNVAGILVERRVALGRVVLNVISAVNGPLMARGLRELGFGVTTFSGEGLKGPVTLLWIVCERREFRRALDTIRRIEPNAFYTTEMSGPVGKVLRPMMSRPTGWRAIFKRK
jgi:uncharacterized protein YebE (UPF0316 family)